MIVELQGQIERITFINEENGFTIARVKVYGQRDLVTVVNVPKSIQNIDPDKAIEWVQEQLAITLADKQIEAIKSAKRIPKRFGFDPVEDVQVLSPMHRGVVGTGNLNMELQKALNPGEGGVFRGNLTIGIKNDKTQKRYTYLRQRLA